MVCQLTKDEKINETVGKFMLVTLLNIIFSILSNFIKMNFSCYVEALLV